MTKKINFNILILKWKFGSKTSKIKLNKNSKFEIREFLIDNDPRKINFLFKKEYLVNNMTYNIIYFCMKMWELSNSLNVAWPFLTFLKKGYLNWFSFFSREEKEKINFKRRKFLFKNKFILFYKRFDLKKKLSIFQDIFFTKNFLFKKLNFSKKNITNKIEKMDSLVKAFLFVWATKNNFFATIIDTKGWTLVTWSGGSSDWIGASQWSSVFAADNTIYEICFLAKQWGVETLIIHVCSTFWLPQIKFCFDSLEMTGLAVNEVVYRPIKTFGGCWLKKPRWV